ncbi:chromosome segregation protein SMC [Rhodocytophaga rosea]|uniref:Chromosome segregation protein SMC n=1 Tax=Rhodocytophaga rosea TaxID=2704465 RepID=A0A6C0GH85_9BACT|nr:chromosome segregation protein SMC [Rhodocytophaga rosea]QHT67062.1 chromosome segregation protein SMC [Rhodocytophaga rosea]
MAEQNQEKQGSRKILLTIFIGILIALNIVLFYLNFRNKEESQQKDVVIQAKDAELDATSTKLDSISKELDLRITEVRKLGGDVEELTKAKADLEKERNTLKTATASERRRLTEKLEAYETLLTTKDEEISKLKAVNEELYSENTTLKTQKNQLNDSISAIEQQKQQLSEKVAVASALKTENLAINALNEKGKERDGGEYRAKQVDKIKIAFNLAENNVAEIESKDIYMRLIEPDGAALFDLAMGGGTFMFEGKETFYTAKQQILFDNTRQQITFVYDKGNAYKTGKHIVELYADGYRIGQGSFVVK